MLYLFLNLFKFFLSYRKANLLESNNELTRFNKFIICWVLFLCFLVLWNIITLIILGISAFLEESFSKVNESPIYTYYLRVMYRIVIPIKDLLIALSFAYLYYHQGMKQQRRRQEEEVRVDLKIDSVEERHVDKSYRSIQKTVSLNI